MACLFVEKSDKFSTVAFRVWKTWLDDNTEQKQMVLFHFVDCLRCSQSIGKSQVACNLKVESSKVVMGVQVISFYGLMNRRIVWK